MRAWRSQSPPSCAPRAHAHAGRAARILVVAQPWLRRSLCARHAAVPELASWRIDQRRARRAVSMHARRLRRRAIASTGCAVEPVGEVSQLHAGASYDRRLQRRSCEAPKSSGPTLVIHGSATVPFPRAINAALLRTLPNSEPFELAGGHNSPASSPDYFVEEWRNFHQRVTKR